MRAAAIIVAAGQGVRLGVGVPKAFVRVGDRPLFAYALRTLSALGEIGRLVLVVPADLLGGAAADEARAYAAPATALTLAAGGAERQDSVAAGLAALGDAADLVLVHDAARPFVRARTARACLAAAAVTGAALVAVPAVDTVKTVGPDGRVVRTLDRSTIWLAQTPQAFRRDWLCRALDAARAAGVSATDEAGLVERLGLPVAVVPGEVDNRKVTTPADLRWAEWYAREEWRAADA